MLYLSSKPCLGGQLFKVIHSKLLLLLLLSSLCHCVQLLSLAVEGNLGQLDPLTHRQSCEHYLLLIP